MAGSSIREVLARVARELEDEETAEEFEKLKNRKVTVEDIRDAIRDAPPEARAEIREILRDEGVLDEDDQLPKKRKPEPPPAPTDTVDEGAGNGKGSRRRTRPGRKSGGAYDWYVDEETGEVVRSPVAVVYSGADEPDEVEMLPPEDELEEEEEEE